MDILYRNLRTSRQEAFDWKFRENGWTYDTLMNPSTRVYPTTVDAFGMTWNTQNAGGGGSFNRANFGYALRQNNFVDNSNQIALFEVHDTNNDRRHTNDDVNEIKRRSEIQQTAEKIIGSTRHYFSGVFKFWLEDGGRDPSWNGHRVVLTQIHGGGEESPPFSIRLLIEQPAGAVSMKIQAMLTVDDPDFGQPGHDDPTMTAYPGTLPVSMGDEIHVFGYIDLDPTSGNLKLWRAINGETPVLWVNRENLPVGFTGMSENKDWKIGIYASQGIRATMRAWWTRVIGWTPVDFGINAMAAQDGQTFPASSRPWTLGDLPGVVRVYDPDTNVTKDGSNHVSSWSDVDGAVALEGTNQPVFTTAPAIGDGSALAFDGTNDVLAADGVTGLPTGASPGYIFAIVQQDALAADATPRTIAAYGGGFKAARCLNRTVNSGVNRFAFGDGDVGVNDTTIVAIGEHMALGYYDGSTGSVWVDGYTPSSVVTALLTTGSNRTRIGANSSNSAAQFWNGLIGHVIFGSGTLTNDDIEKLFGYFAWRYGLTGLLPSNHPYKREAPTVSLTA